MNRRDTLKILIGTGVAGGLGGSAYKYYWPPRAPSATSHTIPVPGEISNRFVDVTQAAGISFQHNSGAFGKKYLPETLGAGCAFFDYDNDGWLDIILINGMSWPEHPAKRDRHT